MDELKILVQAELNKALSEKTILKQLDDIADTLNRNGLKIKLGIDDAYLKNLSQQIKKATAALGGNDPKVIYGASGEVIKDLSKAQETLGETTNQTNEVISEQGKSLDSMGKKATATVVGVTLLHQAIMGLRDTARDMVNTAVDLDKRLTDLRLVTGNNYDEAAYLVQTYNDLARELSSTTSNILEASDAWLRQGYSIRDTNELIEQSTILSKVGAMGATEATESLTSAVKGYKMEVSDVAGIVDKLTSVDLEAAVSSQDLAVAMSHTAASASIAGISMDKLLGYIATVQETTQKTASVVGESFKTIFARMGNVKLGKFIDADGEDLSEVETVLKNFGIALRDTKDEFRNFDDVLDDVGSRWNAFTTVEQRAIATTFAGVRQYENFLVLMENYGKSIELAGVAADSAGTALQRFGAYEDSISAKANKFVAAFESLSMNTVDAGLVKGLIDAGASVLTLIDNLDLLQTALAALAAVGAVKGFGALSGVAKNLFQHVKQLTTAFNILGHEMGTEQFNELLSVTKGLSASQLRLIVSNKTLTTAQRTSILTANGMTAAEAQQTLATMGLASAEGAATAATFSLSGAMKALGAAFASNPIGFLVVGLTTVASIISSVVSSVNQAQEEIRQKAEEAAQAVRDEINSLNELVETYSEISETQGINADTRDDLLKIQTDLIDKYGIEAENIDLLNGKYEDNIRVLKELQLEKLKAAEDTLQADLNAASKANTTGAFTVANSWFPIGQDLSLIDKADIENLGVNWGIYGGIGGTGDMAERVESLNQAIELLKASGREEADIYTALVQARDEYVKSLDREADAEKALNDNRAEQIIRTKELESGIYSLSAASAEQIEQLKSASIKAAEGRTDIIDAINRIFAAYPTTDIAIPNGMDKFAEVLSEITEKTNILNKAMQEQSKNGRISQATYAELLAKGEDFKKLIDIQDGNFVLLTDDTLEYSDAQITAAINTAILNGAASEQITLLKTLYSIDPVNPFDDLAKSISQYSKASTEAERSHLAEQMQTSLEAIKKKAEAGAVAWNAYEDAVNRVKLITSDYVTDVLSKLADHQKAVQSATDDLENGNGITVETYSKLLSLYPNLQSALDGYLQGLISEKELQAAIATESGKAIQATQEAATTALRVNSDKFQNLSKLYGFDYGNVTTIEALKTAVLSQETITRLGLDQEYIKDRAELYKADYDAFTAYQRAMTDALNQKTNRLIGDLNARRLAIFESGLTRQNVSEYKAILNELELAKSSLVEYGTDFTFTVTDIPNLDIGVTSAARSTSSARLDALLDSGKLYLEQLKDLESNLADVENSIESIQRGISFAGEFGTAEELDGYNQSLLDANREREKILNEILSGSRGLSNEIAKTFSEFASVDMSEYGISSFRQGIQNEITAIDNQISKTEKDAAKRQLEIQKQSIEQRLSRFNDYVEAVQYASKQEESYTKLISEARLEILESELKINDERSNRSLALLEENFSKTSDEVTFKKELLELSEDENISLAQKAKILEQIAAFDQNERYQNWLDNSKFEVSALEENGADELDVIRKWKTIMNGINEEIQYWMDQGYSYQSEKIQALTGDLTEAQKAIEDSLRGIVTAANESLDSIQNVYGTLKKASEEFSSSGAISIETFKQILALGVENLAYLTDEEGKLTANSEALKKAILAKNQDLSISTALNYVKALGTALTEKDTVALNKLLYATQAATDSTWGLVYSSLALLNLDRQAYSAAKANIDALRSLADTTAIEIENVSESLTKSLETQRDSLSSLLEFVISMIKWEKKVQIDSIKSQIENYKKLVDQHKTSLQITKEEAGYKSSLADKTKDISDLQNRINRLSLDDSREAQAERIKLEEELAERQRSLAETQADHAYEVQIDNLDKMTEAFEDEKNEEIKIVEDSVSSYEKLYSAAISRIDNEWSTLYDDLMRYNWENGNSISSEITNAWNSASEAVNRYGSYLEAVSQTQSQLSMLQNQSSSVIGSNVVGNKSPDLEVDNRAVAIQEVQKLLNSLAELRAKWNVAKDAAAKKRISDEGLPIGQEIGQWIGRPVVRGADGVWYLDSVGSSLRLYDVIAKSGIEGLFKYHTGTMNVGAGSKLKDNEVAALLEKGEAVLPKEQKEGMYELVDFYTTLSEMYGKQITANSLANSFVNSPTPIADRVSLLLPQEIPQANQQNSILNPVFNINFPNIVGSLDPKSAAKLSKEIGDATLNRLLFGFKSLGIKSSRGAAIKP